jgi:ABC-type sulfate transport system permease component
MEKPRAINRFLLWCLAIYAALAIGFSIAFGQIYILLDSIAALAFAVVACGMAAIINVIIFTPIFWLLARFTPHKPKLRDSPSDNSLA